MTNRIVSFSEINLFILKLKLKYIMKWNQLIIIAIFLKNHLSQFTNNIQIFFYKIINFLLRKKLIEEEFSCKYFFLKRKYFIFLNRRSYFIVNNDNLFLTIVFLPKFVQKIKHYLFWLLKFVFVWNQKNIIDKEKYLRL